MAKLLIVEEKNAKKANVIKGIILVVSLLAILLAAWIWYEDKDDNDTYNTTEAPICVHVKGAVMSSGLYNVPYGTRVNDLSDFTGGFLDNADLDGINLARYVKDGEEIYIPFKGSAESGGYNLNTVTEKELVEKVEGIGETYAKKIVAYREKHGSFITVSELKVIIGDSVYEKVREKFYIE